MEFIPSEWKFVLANGKYSEKEQRKFVKNKNTNQTNQIKRLSSNAQH